MQRKKKAANAVFHFPHKNSTSRSTRSGAALDATLRLGLEPARHREPRGAHGEGEVRIVLLGRQEETDHGCSCPDARPREHPRHPAPERVVALDGTVQPRISRPPVHPRRDVPVERESLAVGDDARHPEPERGCPAAPREGVLGGGPAGEEGLARELERRIGIRNDLGRGHLRDRLRRGRRGLGLPLPLAVLPLIVLEERPGGTPKALFARRGARRVDKPRPVEQGVPPPEQLYGLPGCLHLETPVALGRLLVCSTAVSDRLEEAAEHDLRRPLRSSLRGECGRSGEGLVISREEGGDRVITIGPDENCCGGRGHRVFEGETPPNLSLGEGTEVEEGDDIPEVGDRSAWGAVGRTVLGDTVAGVGDDAGRDAARTLIRGACLRAPLEYPEGALEEGAIRARLLLRLRAGDEEEQSGDEGEEAGHGVLRWTE